MSTISYLYILENVVAELDTIFNKLLEVRQQKIFVKRDIDKTLLRTYAAVGLALQSLIKDLSGQKKVENISFGEFTFLANSNMASTLESDFSMILKALGARIHMLKERIKALDDIKSTLVQLNIINRLESDDAILDIRRYGNILIIIASRNIILCDSQMNALQLISINDLDTVSYKRSLIFRGCEIRTKSRDVIRLPVSPDVAFELKRILDKAARRRNFSPEAYVRNLKARRSKLRPAIIEAKLSILRKIIPLV